MTAPTPDQVRDALGHVRTTLDHARAGRSVLWHPDALGLVLAIAEAAWAMFAAGRASHEALSAKVDVQRRMDATSAQWRIDYETAASLSIAADARFHEAHAALRTAVAALDAPPTT